MHEFLKTIRERVLVGDGAMGTMLYASGISFDHCFDEVNVSHPDIVTKVHREYAEAGADILETNTFGGNRVRLAQHGFEDDIVAINQQGVRLARTVAESVNDRKIWVAGSVGPLGKPLEPIGKITHDEAMKFFREQIEALVDAGVDIIMIETMSDLAEALQAVRAARAVSSDIPVVAQMSFNDEGKTLMGNKPAEAVRTLHEHGANVVGANCSVGPQVLLDVMERMSAATEAPLIVQPNAGLPRFVGGRYLYLTSADYFGEYSRKFVATGAHIVGGCCGTTPEHIRSIRNALGNAVPAPRRSSVRVTADTDDVKTVAVPKAIVSSLVSKFKEKKFIVSVELDPPRGLHYEKVVEGAVLCKRNNVDAVNIADNPLAKAGMTPLAMASLISETVHIETILHFSCRDRNLLAMQSELMSAYVLHIRNILAITGDPPVVGDYPHATGVFDVDSIGLLKLMSRLNDGVDLAGKPIGAKTQFLRACAANPTAVDLSREYDRYEQKIAAGAEFAMTQVLYDVKPLEEFAKRFKGRIPVLVGIMPLKNAKHANYMHFEIPDIQIPEAIRERMAAAGDKGMEEGIRISKEFLSEAKDLVDGVYVMPPFNRFEMAFEVLSVL